jgi:hypothetical protein
MKHVGKAVVNIYSLIPSGAMLLQFLSLLLIYTLNHTESFSWPWSFSVSYCSIHDSHNLCIDIIFRSNMIRTLPLSSLCYKI